MGGQNGCDRSNIGNQDKWSAASIHILGKKKVKHISYDSIKDALTDKENYDMITNFCKEYYEPLDEECLDATSVNKGIKSEL
eukprot:661319-Ditylum_brightwellii.AAC.1